MWPGKHTVMVQNKNLPARLDVSACKCIQGTYILHAGEGRLSYHCSVCILSGGFAVLWKRMHKVSICTDKHNSQIQLFSVDGPGKKC